MNKRTLFKFRLYTADHTMNSTEALADHIRMTPTLLKLSPSPVRRITGTLSRTPLVLAALGLQTAPA